MIWCRSEYSPTAPAAKTHEWLLVYLNLSVERNGCVLERSKLRDAEEDT